MKSDYQSLLEVDNLTVELQLGKRRVPVVRDLSFTLDEGRTLALVGESGSGKSMTALALMGILPRPPALPPTGSVRLRGRNLLDLSERGWRDVRGRKIAMIFQDPMSALNPVYTVGEQLREMAALHLADPAGRIEEVLQDVGITPARLADYPHQLSGGLKQRIMIAMALLAEPDILIADEPTTALDVTIQAQILELMRTLQRKRGTAILFITHDMGVVAEMADDVVVMYASQAVERAPVATLFDRMMHPYTQGLFKARPHGAGVLQPIEGHVPSATQIPSGCPFHPRCPQAMAACSERSIPMYRVDESHTSRCLLQEPTCSE